MSYETWTTGIYNLYDAMFKYHELNDEILFLRNKLKEAKVPLYDDEGMCFFKPKDVYDDTYYRKHTTTGKKDN